MKRAKYYLLTAITTVLLVLSGPGQVQAVSTITSPPVAQPAANVLISSFGFADSSTVFVELYNQADTPVTIDNWQLNLVCMSQDPACVAGTCYAKTVIDVPKNNGLNGWLRSKSYYTVLLGNFACNSTTALVLNLTSAGGTSIQTISSIPQPTVLPTVWQQYQRNYSVNSTRNLSDNFSTDYEKLSDKDAAAFTPYSDPFYYPPADSKGLVITEVLPHSKSCLPWDDDTLCHDYIKLHRAAGNHEAIAPGEYSLAYKSADSGNVHYINLVATPSAGQYTLVNTDNVGDPLDLTNSGGYVWLTDAGNVAPYKNTAVNYPSASSDSYIGASYAFDGSVWQWTSTPQPFGQNKITALAQTTPSSTSSLTPCRSDQYRNPTTNRCNLKVNANTLVPCATNQYRNPATNRCNSLSSSSALKPCAADQYRNPATNRCKSKASAANNLKPCQPGWVRNPDTNRCRKDSAVKGATSVIKDVKIPTQKSHTEWIIAAVVVAAALAYGAYEWRSELLRFAAGVKNKFKK